MKTFHKIFFKDSRYMEDIENESVQLVVTSPPYPMIKIWDDLFSKLDPQIGEMLDFLNKKKKKITTEKLIKIANETFVKMHSILLEPVWEQISRVLIPGGIVCINIGDATRNLGGIFQLFPNHIKVIEFFRKLGFITLPYILWKKPTNKPNAFLGSGFLPPNAYVTLDVEYILIFRKGEPRKFPPKYRKRYESKFTKEERDKWFTQIWEGINGEKQTISNLQRRTASYPEEIPYRLIRMFSIKGDTILDPFLGLGTTTVAAIKTERNSIGYEIDISLKEVLLERVETYANFYNAKIELIENSQLLVHL